jgi:uncharacterized phage protein gp47/JayE
METGFIRPSLTDLIARLDADLATRLGAVAGEEQRSLRIGLSRALGQGQNLLFGFLETIATEALPDTAVQWLVREADWYGIQRRAAAFASGSVVFTGAPGSAVPLDARMQSPLGVEYAVTAEAIVGGGGSVTVAVEALLPGAAGNREGGAPLTLISPLSGLQAALVVAAGGLVGGAEIESLDSLRARLRARVRMPPHGGNHNDYIEWTRQHSAAITGVWPDPLGMGPGTVVVRFMMHDTYEHGIPLEADVDALQAYLDRPDIRPVCSEVHVVAPLPLAVEYQISGLNPGSASTRAAVEAELRDLHRREGVPGQKLLISHIRAAISLAAGEVDHVLAAPDADIEPEVGEVPIFGGIEWL